MQTDGRRRCLCTLAIWWGRWVLGGGIWRRRVGNCATSNSQRDSGYNGERAQGFAIPMVGDLAFSAVANTRYVVRDGWVNWCGQENAVDVA